MTLRPLHLSDVPILNARAQASGYPYPSPDDSELILVIEAADGTIITACAAKKLIELYLWPSDASPATLAAALNLLHREMPKVLLSLGYTSAEAFIPPEIAGKFGRRLERSWGWVKNWSSWSRRL